MILGILCADIIFCFVRGEPVRKLALIFICLLLTGCQAITFSVDGLLGAPNIADEQSAIYQALIESAGRGITLEYPRNGDYRSAFVLYDIDGDGEDETLAFYSVSSVAESNVKISILDRGIDDKWRSMYEIAGAGSSVERVLFSGEDIVVGYSAQDYEENALRMYRYSGGELQAVYEDTYSILERADLDGCGADEIAAVKRSGLGVEVYIIKASRDQGYGLYRRELETGASTISGYGFGTLDGCSALYLDISPEEGGLQTEIFYLGEDGVVCPISQNGLSRLTLRPAGYSSRDYDGDGAIEIPTVNPFTGYETAAWGEAEYMTELLGFNTETLELETESFAYYNLSDRYMLTIPNRWLNVVTVAKNASTGEVTFYKYESNKSSIGDMTPIMSFASSDSSGAGTEDYTAFAETDMMTYYVRTVAGSDEPLVLTMDEIKDNFHIME